MDWKTRQRAIRDTSISAEARFVWDLIDTFADRDGTGAHPSVPTLARICCHRIAWVEGKLRELKHAGWIEVVGKVKTPHGWVNNYVLGHPEKQRDPVPAKNGVRGHPEKPPSTIDSIPGNSKPRRKLPGHFLPDEFGGTMRPVSFSPSPPNGR